jgi:hypothetical protein
MVGGGTRQQRGRSGTITSPPLGSLRRPLCLEEVSSFLAPSLVPCLYFLCRQWGGG